MINTQDIGAFEIIVGLGIFLLWAGGATWASKIKGKYLDRMYSKKPLIKKNGVGRFN
jgi:hypothetical protein